MSARSVAVALSRPALAVVEEGRQKKWTVNGCVRMPDMVIDGWPAFRIYVDPVVARSWAVAAKERGCTISVLLIDAYTGKFNGARGETKPREDQGDGWKDSEGGDPLFR